MQRTIYFSRILFIALMLVFKANVSAQTYTVQTNLSTSPPYYNYLSHFADQNNHLQVILTLLDFNTPPINVRLQVRIEGPGYELYTNPNVVVGQPLELISGVPLFLNDLDLQPYLQESNLIVSPSGIDINKLPEGYTTICVDVILDGTNQEVISSNNCTSFILQRFTPSVPFSPNCESVLDTNQMFHSFQWTDPMGYIPDVNTTLEYTFSLYRWNDPNNFTIFESDQGLVWRETVNFPMVQISDFDIAFENGGLYVWRVESQIYSNGMPVHMIENNGISLPCTFHYGEPQSLVDILTDGLYIDLNTEPTSDRKGKAYWSVIDNTPNEGLSTFDKYLVEYRRQPTGNESYSIPWFADTLIDTLDFIYQLEPSTTYEVKVSGIVGGVIGDPTPVEIFTTQDPRVYACGQGDLPYFPFTWSPLENAQAGIQVQIGQFVMNTTQIQSVGLLGHYSGKGTVSIPFLMGAKAKVTFDDILIDTEYLVREGRVDVVTQGLESWLHDQYGQLVDPIYVSGVIDSAYVDSSGVAWAVVDGISIPFTFDPPDYPIILNDENGNQYTIYPNDSITVSSYVTISENWYVDPDEVAIFSQNDNENRGFDPKQHMQWHENYEIMRLSDSSLYFVANKSMAEGESDVVNVELPQGTQASFQLADGTPISSGSVQGNWIGQSTYPSGVKHSLTIPSFQSSGNYEIHVFANNQKVGQLNVVVYSEKQKEVIVVPLVANLSVTESDIKTKLDETLGEANINVTVTLAPQWNDTTFTETTVIGLPNETGLLTKYSDDMRDLRDAYFDQNPDAPKDVYYLFLINEFDDASEVGYMVRGRGMGFIKATQSDVLNTIAHELGHGIGALEHTWKHNGPEQDSTTNLMDYGTVSGNLIKEQWKELRDLDVFPSLWDSAEDASLSGDIVYYYKVKLNSSNQVISRQFWQKKHYVRLCKDSNLDGDWDSPYLYDDEINKVTSVHYIFNESGKLINSYRYKNVTYYNFNWVNGAWVRTFDTHSDHITLSNYNFPVSYAYTVKKFYRNSELIAEKVYNWKGDRMDVSKLAFNVNPVLSIHARGAEFLADHLESSLVSYLPYSNVHLTSYKKVSDGYDVLVYTMELGLVEAAIISELTIHIPNTATRYDMQDLFREYGLIQNMDYDYSLFIRNVPDTWTRYGNWLETSLDGAQGGSPPFVIQLFADILMGAPSAIYGFATGQNWRTGETLTGWDHVWNSLEIIPAAGVFAKTFKNGVKGLKVYNKTTGVVFDVIQAAKKMPASFASKLSNLKQKGLHIAASVENELYLVINQTGEKLVRIKDEIVEILKPYMGTSNQPQWSLDLGNMQVKIGDDVVEQSVEIRKYGNNVRVVANTVESFANQIDNTIARLTGNANFSLTGTGKYKTVKGHHPMAKKAFEGDLAYDYKEAFSVKVTSLEDAWKTANQGIPQNVHGKITGQQNSLYSSWRSANPAKKLSVDEMADIEIQAMVNAGIPQDIATGWIVKSLEDLKLQGVTEIKNIPWNGAN